MEDICMNLSLKWDHNDGGIDRECEPAQLEQASGFAAEMRDTKSHLLYQLEQFNEKWQRTRRPPVDRHGPEN